MWEGHGHPLSSSQANGLEQEEAVSEFRSKGQAHINKPNSLLVYLPRAMSGG